MAFLSGLVSDITGGTNKPVASNPNVVNFQDQGAYQQAQGGVNQQIQNQSDLAKQLSGQIGNQIGLQGQLNAQGGLGNQSSVFNQQQALANQLASQAQGQGPNPAQALLSQQTGTNVANQGALMASQRGASANPALLARQAAQQGAATQQQSVGQAATLQAQQQLAAEQSLQNQQQMQANLANQQVGNQIQNQQVLSGQQLQQGQNLTANQLANQQAILGALGQQNATQAGIQNTQQQGQNALSAQNQQMTGQLVGSIGSGIINAAKTFLAKGGEVPNPKLNAVASSDRFPSHALMPPHLKEMATLYHGHSFDNPAYQRQTKMAEGGEIHMGSQLKEGGKVPGQAKVKGDSEKNDVVSAKLSPGEVVLPRSVMQSADPVQAAAQFVAGLQKKKGHESGREQGDFRQALQRAIASRKKKVA